MIESFREFVAEANDIPVMAALSESSKMEFIDFVIDAALEIKGLRPPKNIPRYIAKTGFYRKYAEGNSDYEMMLKEYLPEAIDLYWYPQLDERGALNVFNDVVGILSDGEMRGRDFDFGRLMDYADNTLSRG